MEAPRWLAYLWRHGLFTITFRCVHFAYFIAGTLLGSGLLCAIEDLAWMDAYFLATSCMTQTGLSTVNFASLNTGSQIFCWLLILLGSYTLLLLLPLLVRLHRYRKAYHGRGKTQILRAGSRLFPAQLWNQEIYEDVVEYEAVVLLINIIIGYFFFFQIVPWASFWIYTSNYGPAEGILNQYGVSAFWFASFHSVAAFNNSGMSLFADSLVPWAADRFVLLLTCVSIVGGQTLIPVFLRLIIRSLRVFATNKSPFDYLLDHGRNVTTHLFPARETLVLAYMWISIQAVEFVCFVAFDWHRLGDTNNGQKLLNGFFQAVSTRTAGFSTVDFGLLSHTILLLYLLFMYISSYPIAITVRQTAVVEAERSHQRSNTSRYFQRTLRTLLFRDISLLYLSWFAITAVEQAHLDHDGHFDLFKILFEIISAYGTVGLSIGYPNTTTSFSARWSPFSQLVLCVVMLSGRHRGLPRSIDTGFNSGTRS
eukprot:GILK01006933.1.p1 GENE.GILK01006933.1~~GILK01006933.1.p1  ORF type:complete len:511 (-),score=29.98 GILK01006933.1:706-2145(-)